ncbi:MAG: hypothetical protein DMG55_22845 [Acidobacteria bacterium]|nr:MAG: hypothetical protein DMG55_22845 [Acidobacteriota bacterium]
MGFYPFRGPDASPTLEEWYHRARQGSPTGAGRRAVKNALNEMAQKAKPRWRRSSLQRSRQTSSSVFSSLLNS